MSAENVRKGPWYEEEDERLKLFVTVLGARRWDSIARISGLKRTGKSCRLRWLNYLRPYLKHDPITPQEEQLILELHQKWGNKWAKIARRLPGRTDNEIKNYWRTHLRKQLQSQQNSSSLLQYSSTTPSPSSSNSVGSSLLSKSSSEQTSNSLNQIEPNLQDGDTITNTEIICDTNNFESIIDEYNGPISGQFYDCDINDKKGLLSDNGIITHSPYENRVSDWINGSSSSGCCTHYGSSLEFCLDDYPMTWSCLGDDSVWDFSDIKWDMDLFNVNNGSLK